VVATGVSSMLNTGADGASSAVAGASPPDVWACCNSLHPASNKAATIKQQNWIEGMITRLRGCD
jgi:hypothetical protein